MAKKKLSRRIEANKRARARQAAGQAQIDRAIAHTRRPRRSSASFRGDFDYAELAKELTVPTVDLPLLSDYSKVPQVMGLLDSGITKFQQERKLLLPKFAPSGTLFVFSDYGGAHKQARYETYSFLLLEQGLWIRQFQAAVTTIREKYNIPAGAEISFKELKKDSPVHSGIMDFARAAHNLFGIVFTLVVDKSLDSVILTDADGGVVGLHSGLVSKGISMKPKPLERALRISFALSYLLKLAAPPQRKVIWITDRDDIVANDRVTNDLLRLLNFSSHNLEDHEERNVELFVQREVDVLADLMAVPDLVAGATSLLLTQRDEGPDATIAKDGFKDILSLVNSQGLFLRNLCFRIRAVDGKVQGEMLEFALKDSKGHKVLI